MDFPNDLDLASREKHVRIEEVTVDIFLRKCFAFGMTVLFFLLNAFACFILFMALTYDQHLLTTAPATPHDLRVTPPVLIALLGGTAAQGGAALVVIAKYLFPNRLIASDE